MEFGFKSTFEFSPTIGATQVWRLAHSCRWGELATLATSWLLAYIATQKWAGDVLLINRWVSHPFFARDKTWSRDVARQRRAESAVHPRSVIICLDFCRLITVLWLWVDDQPVLLIARPFQHVIARCQIPMLMSLLFVRASFGARSFSVAAPKIWNSLPPALRRYTSPITFRSQDSLFPAGPPSRLTPSLL